MKNTDCATCQHPQDLHSVSGCSQIIKWDTTETGFTPTRCACDASFGA